MWRSGKNFARGKGKGRKCWRNLGKKIGGELKNVQPRTGGIVQAGV